MSIMWKLLRNATLTYLANALKKLVICLCAFLFACAPAGIYEKYTVPDIHFPKDQISNDVLVQYAIAFCQAPTDESHTRQTGKHVNIILRNGGGSLQQTITTVDLKIHPSPFLQTQQQGHPEDYDLGCYDNQDQDIRYNAGRLYWISNSDILTFTAGLNPLISDFRSFQINNDLSFIEIDPPLTRYDYFSLFGSPKGIFWSSNGKKFATLGSDNSGDLGTNIWIFEIEQKSFYKATNISEVGNHIATATWSPDNKKIAVGYGGPDSGLAIVGGEKFDELIEITNKTKSEILSNWPHWATTILDYSQMLLQGMDSIQKFNLELALNSQPVWLNNTQIVFVAANREGRSALFSVNADGTELYELLPGLPGLSFLPRLSPDGKMLAFVRFPDWNDRSKAEIAILNMNTMELSSLIVLPEPTEKGIFFISGIDWTPDGKFLAFSSPMQGESDIYVIASDGSVWLNITENIDGDAVSPVWKP